MSMPSLSFTCSACDYKGSSMVGWGARSYQCAEGSLYISSTLGWCFGCARLAPLELLHGVSPGFIESKEKEKIALEAEVSECRQHLVANQSWFAKWRKRPVILPDNIKGKAYAVRELEKEISEAKVNQIWLARRQSPPRCLTCSSTDIRYLPEQFEPAGDVKNPGPPIAIGFKHPECGGDLLVAHCDIWFNVQITPRVYSEEGILLYMKED